MKSLVSRDSAPPAAVSRERARPKPRKTRHPREIPAWRSPHHLVEFAVGQGPVIVLVKSAKAAKRLLAALIHYCEGRLQLSVNRAKSRAAPLKQCAFLGYRVGSKGKLVWTEKVQHRFKERVREWERSGHRVSGGEPREACEG